MVEHVAHSKLGVSTQTDALVPFAGKRTADDRWWITVGLRLDLGNRLLLFGDPLF
jgi:hypothetical protein